MRLGQVAATLPLGSFSVSRRWGALAVPSYRTFFLGSVVALTGGWLLRTAQSWLVLDLTGSAAALGVVAIVQTLPVTLLTLFAGVVIDRVRTQRLMVAVQVAIGGQAGMMAFLVLTHQIQYWHILVLAAIQGVASAFDLPGRSAIVSELVEPDQVGNGVVTYSALNSAARIVGPALGGVLIAVWGTGICLAVTSASYVGATAAWLMLRTAHLRPKAKAEPGAVVGQLVEGLKHSFSTSVLAFTMVLTAFVGTFAYNWATVLPLLARYGLGTGAEGFGTLNMAMGIGSTIGGIGLATRSAPSIRLVLGASVIFAMLILVLAWAPSMLVAVPLLICTGVASVVFMASTNTLVQVEARPDLRGRVVSLYMLLMIGSTPIGAALTGFIAAGYDIRVAILVNGSMCLVGVVVAALFLRRARSRSELVEAG